MSRAFTKDEDVEAALADIGERPVSPHRNLVTESGLAQIEAELAQLHVKFGEAERNQERERIARVARDLRYWTARRENAELSVPERDSKVVRFGMTVRIANDEGKAHSWKIVGEDEADAAAGMISHVSPMALALFGKGVGDVATVNGKDWEIVGVTVE